VSTISALPYVSAIAPYQAGKPIDELAREFGLDPGSIIKLASNENPRGMPESAQRAMAAAVQEFGRYPDSNGFALKKALSSKLDVPVEWITLGNGSNDILELAASALLAPGRSCVFSQHSFAVYALATQARGARALVAPARELAHDLDAMLAAIEADTAVVYIANPNNPTGTHLGERDIENFLARVPAHVVTVIDEAYNEYLPLERRSNSVLLARKYSNVLLSRTFSKAYGLAGLRVGYGLAHPQLTELLNRVRQPFNVNAVAQAAAVAALEDDAFLDESYRLNRAGMEQLGKEFHALGLAFVPGFGNFLLVKVGAAARVYEALLKQGVIVRPVANYGLPEWLRVTVGLETENARFLTALKVALHAAPETSRA